MLIVLIIMGALVLYAILRLAWMFWRNEELEAGGSWGRQIRTSQEKRSLFRRGRRS